MAPRSHFSARQCLASHGKGVTRLSPHRYFPSLSCPILRFVSNQAHLGSFGTASWASHEFERTRGKTNVSLFGKKIASHNHLDDSLRWRAGCRLEAGRAQVKVARKWSLGSEINSNQVVLSPRSLLGTLLLRLEEFPGKHKTAVLQRLFFTPGTQSCVSLLLHPAGKTGHCGAHCGPEYTFKDENEWPNRNHIVEFHEGADIRRMD
ncbi:hypothetical protein TNCV_2507711 [Trichonephila clavipes]|nr:hypothetical protein TNCV_2507711 [Trichonephila clavipes]